MKQHTILIVDDDSDSREILKDILFVHFGVVEASNAAEAIESILTNRPSLVLLDMNMPGPDGIEVCRKIRSHPEVGALPVIMISGESSEAVRTKAFLSGVDDFISKPASGQELLARIFSKLSWQRQLVSHSKNEIIKLGKLQIDDRRMMVTYADVAVKVTHLEYVLLKYFVENRERVLSRERIIEEVWQGRAVGVRTIDTHIYSLRQKLEDFEYEFCTVHGSGYMFRLKAVSESEAKKN